MRVLSRRAFLVSAAATAVSLPRLASARQEPLVWHDVKTWGVEGKGFADTLRYYDRFPAKAEKTVPAPVWDLSRHSAGMLVRFETDAPAIHARWALLKAGLALPHMSDRSSAGEGPRFSESAEGGAVLRSSDRLDTTTRPDNSDEVVLSIQADFGTFWRGETFDVWDGRSWTRSADARMPVFGEVVPAADDPGAAGPVVNEQRIEVEATYADIVFAAASAVEVDAGPRQLAQRPDGTLLTSGAAMGRGAAQLEVDHGTGRGSVRHDLAADGPLFAR